MTTPELIAEARHAVQMLESAARHDPIYGTTASSLARAIHDTMATPSPGPWYVDRNHICNVKGDVLASMPRTLGDETNLANARLMASAPALLEVVYFMLVSARQVNYVLAKGAKAPGNVAENVRIYRYATRLLNEAIAAAVDGLAAAGELTATANQTGRA